MPELENAVAAVEQLPEPEQGPVEGEDFYAAMRRHGWSEDTAIPGEVESEPEEQAEKETEEPKEAQDEQETEEPEPKDDDAEETEEEPPAAAKRTEIENPEVPADLRELARKYGFEIEGKRVTGKDWAGFNQAKRRKEAALKKREDEINTYAKEQTEKFAKLKDEFSASISQPKRVIELLQNFDFEGFAQEVGFKDFNEFQEVAGAQLADPNYRRIRAAEKKAEEAERIAKERADKIEAAAKEREEKAIAAEREAGIRRYKAELASGMAESQNPYLAAFADDPWAIESLFKIQQEHYDRETQSTVSPEDALDQKVPGTDKTLREGLDYLINRVHRHIGKLRPKETQETKDEQETKVEQVAKAAKPANKTSPNKQPDGGNHKDIGDMTAEEYDSYMRRKLKAAIEDDNKKGLLV